MDFSNATLPMQLKAIIRYRGFTVKRLCAEYNQKNNTSYVPQSFSRKISDEAFKFSELQKLGEILGFKVKLEVAETTLTETEE